MATSTGPPKRVLEQSYTILLVGNARVGKSSLMQRFAGRYSDFVDRGSRGIEQRNFVIGGNLVRIVVHDSDPNFLTMLESYYAFSVGVILVYAINDNKSFDSLHFWLKHFQEHGRPDSVVTVIGTKKDLDDRNLRVVPNEKGAEFARANDFSFMEVSAKEDEEKNVDAAFRIIACEIYSRVHAGHIDLERVKTI